MSVSVETAIAQEGPAIGRVAATRASLRLGACLNVEDRLGRNRGLADEDGPALKVGVKLAASLSFVQLVLRLSGRMGSGEAIYNTVICALLPLVLTKLVINAKCLPASSGKVGNFLLRVPSFQPRGSREQVADPGAPTTLSYFLEKSCPGPGFPRPSLLSRQQPKDTKSVPNQRLKVQKARQPQPFLVDQKFCLCFGGALPLNGSPWVEPFSSPCGGWAVL